MKRPFEQTVADHGATVLRVCRAVLGSHDADDAWSETFLAALRAWPELPDSANVEAWLVTIARRKAIDVLRATQRHPRPVEAVPELPSDLGIPGTTDDELWLAVAALPPKQRQVITFRYLAGMSHAEIAAALGGTPAAARRAAADGLITLRRTWPGIAAKEGLS